MTQSQCRLFLFFSNFINSLFQNSNVLVVSRLQRLILAEGDATLNV
jgi:hypothetical protein